MQTEVLHIGTRLTALAARCIAAAALSFTVLGAQADDVSDVQKLLAAGKNAEALQKADQFLTAKPRDPMMRFLRGISLSQAGRAPEAITAFTKLTEDYPELPEPFNNLAVLYAQQGQYDKARNALEMAIRTNPSYATAYENLGDVYAKLASQAYSKALQIDTKSNVAPKLAMIKDLFPRERNSLIAAAGGSAACIGLIASFAPTLSSMPPEFPDNIRLECELVEDAMLALDQGALEWHDDLVAAAAIRLRERGAQVIALAQFSMARAADAVRTPRQVVVVADLSAAQ